MKVIKRLDLSQDEFNILISAGELLGKIRDAKIKNEFDEYSDGSKTLLEGLLDVTSECLTSENEQEVKGE